MSAPGNASPWELDGKHEVRSVDTMSEFSYRPINGDTELDSLAEILGECFNAPPEKLRSPVVGETNIRYLTHGDTPAGGLWLIPMGQYFGHRSVPMTGIAASRRGHAVSRLGCGPPSHVQHAARTASKRDAVVGSVSGVLHLV